MLHKNRLTTIMSAAAVSLLLAQTCIHSLRAADLDAPKPKGVALALDANSTVALDADRNGMPAKTKLTATAPYEGYSLGPVVDGIKKRKDLGPQEAAWASEEEANPHGVEIQFPQPQHGGRFQITWAYDTNGDENVHWWSSRDFVIQVKAKATDDWKTVTEVKNNQSSIGCYPLPETPFSFLRIYQLPGGGHTGRPNLMWIGQLELVD
jgi:hypothetical protein